MGQWGRDDTDHDRFLALQEQAGVHLRRKASVTLEASATYYQSKVDDKSLPLADRKVWQLLLDEVETRLGRRAPPSVQEELFSIPKPNDRST